MLRFLDAGESHGPALTAIVEGFPAGLKLMPHFHPDEWRTGVVLSGTYYFGVGEQWDETKLKSYSAGTFF